MRLFLPDSVNFYIILIYRRNIKQTYWFFNETLEHWSFKIIYIQVSHSLIFWFQNCITQSEFVIQKFYNYVKISRISFFKNLNNVIFSGSNIKVEIILNLNIIARLKKWESFRIKSNYINRFCFFLFQFIQKKKNTLNKKWIYNSNDVRRIILEDIKCRFKEYNFFFILFQSL